MTPAQAFETYIKWWWKEQNREIPSGYWESNHCALRRSDWLAAWTQAVQQTREADARIAESDPPQWYRYYDGESIGKAIATALRRAQEDS